MNVRELIAELEKIENKGKEVLIWKDCIYEWVSSHQVTELNNEAVIIEYKTIFN